jgi:hypothetical protein
MLDTHLASVSSAAVRASVAAAEERLRAAAEGRGTPPVAPQTVASIEASAAAATATGMTDVERRALEDAVRAMLGTLPQTPRSAANLFADH